VRLERTGRGEGEYGTSIGQGRGGKTGGRARLNRQSSVPGLGGKENDIVGGEKLEKGGKNWWRSVN